MIEIVIAAGALLAALDAEGNVPRSEDVQKMMDALRCAMGPDVAETEVIGMVQ